MSRRNRRRRQPGRLASMTCDVISTGACLGNAVLLNGSLLFDCGVRWKQLEPHSKGISLVFLTHLHTDHFNSKSIFRLAKRRPRIQFVCARNCLLALATEAKVPLDRIILVRPEDPPRRIRDWINCQDVVVSSFHLIHDVENVGWRVTVTGEDTEEAALYATDTHHIPIEAPGLDLYMIEANYRMADMQRRISKKTEQGLFSYEPRVMQSHMSMETAMDWLRDNADPYKSKIVFLHGHTEKKEGELDGRSEAVYHV